MAEPASSAAPASDYESPDDVIHEAREVVRLVESAEHENRAEAERDLAFKAGEQYPERVRQAREAGDVPRPCLVLNETLTFTAQITNDYKQNPPGVLVHPVDSAGDPKVAEVIEGLGRHILYASSGQAADEVAFQSAVDIGWGYLRLYTDYVSEASFDQQILFGAIHDPLSVYFDPHSTAVDGSDCTSCVLTDTMSRQEFERLYPDAEACQTALIGTRGIGAEWLDDDSVRVAEYYCCEYVPDTLLRTTTGQTLWQSQLESDPELQRLVAHAGGVAASRPVQRKTIKWYKLTAVDILDERTIPGQWIPVVPFYGNWIMVRGRRKRFGLVRFLRDPQIMLNYWETTKTELLALQPRAPWVGPEGFMRGHEDEWKRANDSNLVALEYNVRDVEGNPITAPPQRMPFPTPPTAIIEAASQAKEYMREISGISQPARLTPGSSRSGASLRAEDQQADMATFHYFRNASASMLHAWRIMLGWFPHYYDAPRVVRILGEDGTSKPVPINQPQTQVTPQGQAIETVVQDLTVGQYDVVLSSGPNYQTKRQEAVEGMTELGRVWPKLLDVAGSDLVRNLNWPGSEQIAKKLAAAEPTMPEDAENAEQALPRVLAQLQQKDQETKALDALAQQMQQNVQQLQQENAALKSQMASKQIDVQVKQVELQVKQAEMVIREKELALRQYELQLETRQAELKAQVDLAHAQLEQQKIRAGYAQMVQNGREGEAERGE